MFQAVFSPKNRCVCVSQRASVCTFLTEVSVRMSVSVTLSLHMHEDVCMSEAAAPGAKWASAEQDGKKERKKLLMTRLHPLQDGEKRGREGEREGAPQRLL